MLEVRYGAFPALEKAFLAELDSLKRASPLGAVAVVTPSQALADRLSRLVALDAGRAYVNVEFLNFHGLARKVLAGAGEDRAVIEDPMVSDRLIDSLLGEGPRPRGLAASYRSSLKDLIDAGVEPRARELVSEGLLADAGEARRLSDLLDLLSRYEARMEELKAAPPSWLTRRAARAAGEGALGGFKALLYYGFYDLTGLQAEFFEAVARERPVTLFFPYLRKHPAFSFADKLFETKLHMGGAAPREVEPADPPALGRALEALFVPGRSGAPPKGALRVFTASGERDEAWRAAKEILRLVEEEGYEFSDVGVVARTLEPYRAAIAEAFAESAVPCRIGEGEPLLCRPAARACLTLLSVARRDFPALAVLDVVESPFFRGKAGRLWRPLLRRLRIHRGWLQWEGRLEPASRTDLELHPQAAAEGRRGLVVPKEESRALWETLLRWRRELGSSEKRRWPAWAEHAERFLRAELASEDPAFEEALAAVRGLAAFDVLDEQVSWAEFLETAEQALARTAREPEEANRGVRVLNAMQARGESFKVLFLVGMQEGVFPRRVREDPLLRDAARERLRDAGGYWISTKLSGYEEEKLLFHLLVSSASERLYCSYTRSDEDGRARVPSVYLLELCRASGVPAKEFEHVPRQPLPRLCDPRLAQVLSLKEATLAAALSGRDARPILREAGLDAAGYEALRRRAASELNRRGEPGLLDGLIGPPEAYLEAVSKRGFSPTQLEELARCPFQFFASRLLRLGDSSEPSHKGEIAEDVKGVIYHRALASFHDRLRRSGWWDRPDAPFPEAELAAAEKEAFAGCGWRELGVYPLLWEVSRDSMRRRLRRLAERDLEEMRASGLVPALFEEPLEAVLDLGAAGKVRFRGVIDRLDAGGGAFRVVDYKTRTPVRPEEKVERLVLAGRRLQPALYLELAGRHPAAAGLEPAGFRFWGIESGESDGRAPAADYPAETHRAQREAVLSVLGGLVETAREGRFAIRPEEGEGGHCSWCSFASICRKNHAATRVRAQREGA